MGIGGRANPGKAIARLALMLALLLSGGCYAKHFPVDGPAVPAPLSASPLALSAGVVAAAVAPDDNVRRIHASDVVEAFARRLEATAIFERVVFPYTELSPVSADVVFEVSVRSKVDLMFWQNLARQAAVGASLLLLQPVLPTEYDLWIDLRARATALDAGWLREHRHKGAYRFRYTLFQAPEAEIQAWKDDAWADAVEHLVAEIARDPELREVPGRRAPERKAGR